MVIKSNSLNSVHTASGDSFIVTLKKKPGAVSAQASTLSAISSLNNVQFVEKISSQAGVHLVKINSPDGAASTIANLKIMDGVENVEENRIKFIHDFIAKETLLDLGYQWGVQKIRAPAAWTFGTGSRDIVVCVIDTGVNYLHPDLRQNMWRNPGETGIDANGNDKATNGIDDDFNNVIDGEFHITYFYSLCCCLTANQIIFLLRIYILLIVLPGLLMIHQMSTGLML
jgi:subtilisin family serine protease